jgi:NAD(P)-dependent dehydrogenase (short-subunit alcohol dehydrogenase family)
MEAYMFKDKILNDRVVVITGGGTGLGKEIAKQFARHGADIIIASRKMEHLEAGKTEIEKEGREVMIYQLDIREPNKVKEFCNAVFERYGKIDILINNAAGNFIYPSEKLPFAGWNAVIDIVLNGSFYCSQIFGKQMIAQRNGQILNILATYAWTGGPGVVHSACAKAGVLAMTRTLAVEWASHNIRVNAIAPGPFETQGANERLWPSNEIRDSIVNQIPAKRFTTTEEVAQAALYLVSPYSGYITGECLVIDGGAWLGKGVIESADLIKRVMDERRERKRKIN